MWTVRNSDNYPLGKFGTQTGALDFALGAANRRAFEQLKNSKDETIEYEVELEE